MLIQKGLLDHILGLSCLKAASFVFQQNPMWRHLQEPQKLLSHLITTVTVSVSYALDKNLTLGGSMFCRLAKIRVKLVILILSTILVGLTRVMGYGIIPTNIVDMGIYYRGKQ